MLIKSEEKRKIIEQIIYFFQAEREEEIGIIAAEAVYDFMLETLGDKIYNQALDDAQQFYKRAQNNLESDYYSLYRRP